MQPRYLSPNYQPAACLLTDGIAFQMAVTRGLHEGILMCGLVGTLLLKISYSSLTIYIMPLVM